MSTRSKYIGCIVGLILGDALCAPYEGGVLERGLWRFIGKTKNGKLRFTDDTQMSMDVAESLIQQNGIDQDHLAIMFSNGYDWSRGYGPEAGRILKNIRNGKNWRTINKRKYPDGSFGNGAAMRVAPISLFYRDKNSLFEKVKKVSEITHAHPLAVEGAWIIALSINMALDDTDEKEVVSAVIASCESEKFKNKAIIASEWLASGAEYKSKEISKALGNGMTALDSCISALYIALSYRNKQFDEMIRLVQLGGGDADTIGSMAGAIWGAYNGKKILDTELMDGVEMPERYKDVAEILYDRSQAV
jgi:poly(ADP-ribose) glycohydrolase ARH3